MRKVLRQDLAVVFAIDNHNNVSSNNYNEVIGTLGKSKIRTMAGDLIFGDSNKDIDNTSIIAYFCSNQLAI